MDNEGDDVKDDEEEGEDRGGDAEKGTGRGRREDVDGVGEENIGECVDPWGLSVGVGGGGRGRGRGRRVGEDGIYREGRVEQKVAIPTQDLSFVDAALKLSA